jgi:hypothetical protein
MKKLAILLLICLSSCSIRGVIAIKETGEHQHILESKIYKQGLFVDKVLWIRTDEFGYPMDSIVRARDKEIKAQILKFKKL